MAETPEFRQGYAMSSRARFAVLIVSAPIILLVVVGGFLSKAVAREEGYQHLRVFEDVVTLILNNYVEPVKSDQIMGGAMQGLAGISSRLLRRWDV